jgi:DNA-binding GntR family transcriptional regulator
MRNAKQGQQQLSETVAAHLREQIIFGTLKKGDFLRIDAIAKLLSVSTTPVREGLLILQSEALVQLLPRRGFVVTGVDEKDVMDLFWAQATLGAELAARATGKLTAAQLEHLEALNTQYEQAQRAQDKPAMDYAGHQFHRTINLAANSPRLAMLMGTLAKQMSNRFYTNIDGQVDDAVEYHPLILKAMRLEDVESVRALMFQHILNGGKNLLRMLERQRQNHASGA